MVRKACMARCAQTQPAWLWRRWWLGGGRLLHPTKGKC